MRLPVFRGVVDEDQNRNYVQAGCRTEGVFRKFGLHDVIHGVKPAYVGPGAKAPSCMNTIKPSAAKPQTKRGLCSILSLSVPLCLCGGASFGNHLVVRNLTTET